MLKSKGASQLADWSRENLCRCHSHKELYLVYLIGSVAVSGKVDEAALAILHRACGAERGGYLSNLLNDLIFENSHETVAGFISDNILNGVDVSFPSVLVMELMAKQWTIMKALVVKALAMLERDYRQYGAYRFMLTILSIDQQPHVTTNPQIRGHAADRLMHDNVSRRTTAPSIINVLALNAVVWQSIFRFLDVETLLGKLPLVCRSWRTELFPMALAYDAGLFAPFLRVLDDNRHQDIIHISPWKDYFLDGALAIKYLGWCILNDALAMTRLDRNLQVKVVDYLQMVTHGQSLLPEIGNCSSYASFLTLFGKAYAFCTVKRPALDRPVFLTDEEYEQAVRYFVCEQGYVLKLCPALMADLSRLFAIIGEDERLMIELIKLNFGSLQDPLLILILRGQTDDLPERLKRLMLSQTEPPAESAKLAAPPNERYKSIADSLILYSLVRRTCSLSRVHLFITSLILYFKDDRATIAKIAKLINGHHPTWSHRDMGFAETVLGKDILQAVNGGNIYTPEEAGLIIESVLGLQSDSWKRIVLL